MNGRRAALLLLLLSAAPALSAPEAKPTPTAGAPARKAPMDFSGTWNLDVGASRELSRALESGLTLKVRQSGNRIWLEPVPASGGVQAEILVADGKSYEKLLGPAGKGQVKARWNREGTALLIETSLGVSGKAEIVQQSRWTLSPDRNVWVRHTLTTDEGPQRETVLVFRRAKGAPRTPAPTTKPAPALP